MSSADGNRSDVGYSAFISHASEDRNVADKVCQQLESAGFRCWIAPRDLRPGQDYAQEIVRGIELSKCLVLILSKSANESKFVSAEVERAYSKGKPVFPLRVEEVLPSRSLELFVSTKHWIDAWHGDLSQHAARLAKELALDPGLDLDISPELRRRVRTRRMLRAAGITVVTAAVAALVAYIVRPNIPDMHAERPATAFFMGALVYPNKPIEVSYMLTDGWDNNGETYNALDNMKSFEIYEVKEDRPLTSLYSADPKQFKGQFRSTRTYKFTIDGLPKRIITCLGYRIPKAGRDELSIQAFIFNPPDSQFATFSAGEAANFKTYDGASGLDCRTRVAVYAREVLKIDGPRSN
jgi:hypothetical protein